MASFSWDFELLPVTMKSSTQRMKSEAPVCATVTTRSLTWTGPGLAAPLLDVGVR